MRDVVLMVSPNIDGFFAFTGKTDKKLHIKKKKNMKKNPALQPNFMTNKFDR